MATYNPSVGTKTQLNVSGLSTLASNGYCVSDEIDHNANKEPDLFVEAEITPSTTPAGNKQAIIFAKASIDGINWSTGPESGTTTTDEQDLYYVGTVPLNSTGTHRKAFSLAAAFGGRLPRRSKIIVKNEAGVTLGTSAVYTAPAIDTTN